MKKRALLSVTDKSGLVDFARGLVVLGFELVSTGGTAKALAEAGLPVTRVSDVTGFPEILEGRVKTLHPKIHGGLLGDVSNPDHARTMEEHGIAPISVVAVNLYQFSKTVAGPHEFSDAVESIDIGGPAMIRAAAKNSKNVFVVVDPCDYEHVLEALEVGKGDLKRELMAKAFAHTGQYDAAISRYLAEESFPPVLNLSFNLRQELRYGENPHQEAAVYVQPGAKEGIAVGELLWGKELSYNNLLDADAAWELVSDLPPNSCAIIKHGNPCGAAHSTDLASSYHLAREADPISAFGGISAMHGVVDEAAALAMTEKGNFLEVVIAEDFTEAGLDVFRNRSGWGKDVRLLKCPISSTEETLQIRSIRGGVLVQTVDEDPLSDGEIVTDRKPTTDELGALRFLWRIVQHVKSNAIVVGTQSQLLGTGAGQMNRVQSVRLALEQAGEKAKGACLASDAFFPFPDSIETAAAAGIKAIVQPGGSKRDAEVVARANELGLAMVMTGIRHFKH